MWILEHLVLWIFIFFIALAQINDLKQATQATALFLILLYLFLGIFFIIIYMGGHIPI